MTTACSLPLWSRLSWEYTAVKAWCSTYAVLFDTSLLPWIRQTSRHCRLLVHTLLWVHYSHIQRLRGHSRSLSLLGSIRLMPEYKHFTATAIQMKGKESQWLTLDLWPSQRWARASNRGKANSQLSPLNNGKTLETPSARQGVVSNNQNRLWQHTASICHGYQLWRCTRHLLLLVPIQQVFLQPKETVTTHCSCSISCYWMCIPYKGKHGGKKISRQSIILFQPQTVPYCCIVKEWDNWCNKCYLIEEIIVLVEECWISWMTPPEALAYVQSRWFDKDMWHQGPTYMSYIDMTCFVQCYHFWKNFLMQFSIITSARLN